MDDAIFAFLSQMPHFSFIPESELRQVAEQARHLELTPGTEFAR